MAFCNLSNAMMSVHFPIHRLEKLSKSGIGKPYAVFQTPIMYDTITPGAELGCVGEVNCVPQLDTIRVLPWAPNTAVALAEFYTRDIEKDSISGSASPYCSRSFLKKQLATLKSEFGYEPVVGLEVEFILFKGYDPVTKLPIKLDDFMYCEDQCWNTIGGKVLTELCETLQDLGIEVYTFHPESGNGQYELSLGPAPMLRAADDLLFIRQALRAIATKHGLNATATPKILLDQPGNGAHIHLSLVDSTGKNIFPDSTAEKKFSKPAEHFIAGVLDHMDAIPAVSMPSINSYARVAKSMWASYYVTWGYENREVTARIACPPYGGSYNNVEFRPHDGAANPYLAFGTYLAAGMDGMRRKLELGVDMKDDPAVLPEEEIEKLGLRTLPRSLPEALDNLAKDQVLIDALGPDLYRVFTSVKRFEYETISKWSFEDQIKLFTSRY
ncbi:glutamine synthetase/guanido kinase [Gonapodya prolifera JEL478]|uniref:Glutamine synthetase n=1 Tax=Gonapodya prolifera (strain JEL478) TaxID=1344416 RepID=A0A139A9R3_GONPJ|nr:glutamine synthetase/guanido kinase [Gonapodya prolifera JEL478]|eukprot:KXS13215.1 glutamine synthetase/guanido kinase [Gonapodya prolifera JEL478]